MHLAFNFWEESSSNYQTDAFVWGLYIPEWHILNLFMKQGSSYLSSCHRLLSVSEIQGLYLPKSPGICLPVCLCVCFKIFCPDVLWLRDQTLISTHRALILLSVILPWNQQEHQILESIRKDMTSVKMEVGFWEDETTYNTTTFSLQDESTIEIEIKAPALAMHLISSMSTYTFV